MNLKYFELSSNQIKIRNTLMNKSFIEMEIYAISNADPNRNQSCFTLDSMKKGINTFTDKPIMGFFNGDDFEQHNGKVGYDSELKCEYWDNSNGEQILGFIRDRDRKEIKEKDGLSWIVTTAMVYTKYNYWQVKRLLRDKNKKVSVEVAILDSEVINGIEYIYDFELIGITILGSKNGIPIQEGIAGAKLSILDVKEKLSYANQSKAICFAYENLQNGEKKTSKADMDTKKALKVNKSKEAMSDTEWGSVDKTALRNKVVEASNFKTIAKDVFLDLRDGWENGETSKLKYPVMQLKGEELVYNRGGLASARGYAEKNGDDAVISKLKSIYKHLDLPWDEEDKKYSLGDPEDYEDKNITKKEESMSEEEICALKNECDELRMRCQDYENKCTEYESKCTEYESRCEEYQNKCAEYETKCGEYEAKCAEYEAKCCDYEAKCTEYESKYADYEDYKVRCEKAESELESIKQEKMNTYLTDLASKMKLNAEETKELTEKCSAKGFSSIEDIDAAVALVYFNKQRKLTEESGSTGHFTAPLAPKGEDGEGNTSKRTGTPSILERLKSNIK